MHASSAFPRPFAIVLCIFAFVVHAAFTNGADAPGGIPTMKPPKYESQMAKKNNTYYGSDGLCGWWNGKSKSYEKSLLDYTNAFEAEKDPMEEGNCLKNFYQNSMHPQCGDLWYTEFKHCSLVQFYNNQLPAPLKDDVKDLLLMLFDGCLMCKQKSGQDVKDLDVKIRLEYEWPAGTLFTTCGQQTNIAGSYHIKEAEAFYVDDNPDNNNNSSVYNAYANLLMEDEKEEKGKKLHYPAEDAKLDFEAYQTGLASSFAFSALLYQRKCEGLFSADPMEEKYQGVHLVINHNCGGSGKEMVLKLPDLKPTEFQNNMAELRGLMLLLDDGQWYQYSLANWKLTHQSLLSEKPAFQNLAKEENK